MRQQDIAALVADDVGLGKTIEAGLVVQELLLRHRARTVLIVCPASLCVKWRDEMAEKFGLDFTIVRPGRLTDGPGAGRVRLGEDVPRGAVSRDDVAAALAEILHAPATVGANLGLTSGDRPIAEAVAAPE